MNTQGEKRTVIGFFCIFVGIAIAIFISCPTNFQSWVFYTLIAIGVGLIFYKSAGQSQVKGKIYGLTFKLRGVVALVLVYILYAIKSSFREDFCSIQLKRTSLTVFVHGKQSKQELILGNQGSVLMFLRKGIRKASIDENGQAFFPDILVGDSVKLEIDFSEPYRSLNPDSTYVISSSKPIYLTVALKGIDSVYGMVTYNEEPLPDVTVSLIGYKNEEVIILKTGRLGGFRFKIPEKIQRKDYQLIFSKRGFKSKVAIAYPETDQSLDIIMEKSN